MSDQAPRVLVAEDDADIRELMTAVLRAGGYEVAVARDGEEAFRLACASPPDAAVLDVAMPGIDGYELTRRLRAQPSTEAIPIVLVSAKAAERDAERGAAAGSTAYVTKPFSPQELRGLLDSLLPR